MPAWALLIRLGVCSVLCTAKVMDGACTEERTPWEAMGAAILSRANSVVSTETVEYALSVLQTPAFGLAAVHALQFGTAGVRDTAAIATSMDAIATAEPHVQRALLVPFRAPFATSHNETARAWTVPTQVVPSDHGRVHQVMTCIHVFE